MNISGSPLNDVWVRMLDLLTKLGHRVEPRGNATTEILGMSTCIEMKQPILTVERRNVSYRFMFAEAYWILTGSNKLSELEKYAPSYAAYSDDGVTLAGAYGPNVVDQFGYVVDTLVNDLSSRQAVMTCWNRKPQPSKDIPCTLSTQFIVRDGFLHVIHNMRSSDIWLGYPYDVFSFVMVAVCIAIRLNRRARPVKLGVFMMSAGSQHLYLKNLQAASLTLKDPEPAWQCPILDPAEWEETTELIDDLRIMRDYPDYGSSMIKSRFFKAVYAHLTR
jgi:thymidylate synthase